MPVNVERKKEVIGSHRQHERDTGSAVVQIALLTERIHSLTGHCKEHAKDHSSRRGLLKIVGRRRRLLVYLKRCNTERDRTLIKELNIRK